MSEPVVLEDLRRPFTPAAVKFKLQTAKMVVAYIDARLVTERLNKVVGFKWSDEYEQIDQRTMLCRLTVQGVTRQDVGVAEPSAAGGLKALYSDALKRAGVKFGIGVSLYGVPRMFADESDLHLNKERKPVGLKPAAVIRFRERYAQWLALHGVKGFGEPLDHGDVDDAQGDAEISDAQPDAAPPPAPARAADGVRTPQSASVEALSPPSRDMLLTLVRNQLAGLAPAQRDALKRRLGLERFTIIGIADWFEQSGLVDVDLASLASGQSELSATGAAS